MNDTAYKPITEEFYTILKDLVARRKYGLVQYFSDINEFITARAALKEIVAENGADYLTLATGEKIRLDRIYRIDDNIAPGYQHYFEVSCDC